VSGVLAKKLSIVENAQTLALPEEVIMDVSKLVCGGRLVVSRCFFSSFWFSPLC